MQSYLHKIPHVSAECTLSLEEEYEILNYCQAEGTLPLLDTRKKYLEALLRRTNEKDTEIRAPIPRLTGMYASAAFPTISRGGVDVIVDPSS